MAARNSINTRGVVGVIIVTAVFMAGLEKTQQLFNKYVDIIVVLLGISLLSVWGAFARIGRTDANLCMQHDSATPNLIGSVVIMIGVTFGLYSGLKPVIDDKNNKYTANTQYALGILAAMHAATLVVIWALYYEVVDFSRKAEATCDEFAGQQHMFLNVAFIGTAISFLYVFYAWIEALPKTTRFMRGLKGAGHGVVYGGITFIFFFYAAADTKEDTGFGTSDEPQLLWTLIPSIAVFLYNFLVGVEIINPKSLKTPVTLQEDNWLKGFAFLALVVVAINIGFATNILVTDVDFLTHSGTNGTATGGDKNNDKSKCFEDDHDDILSMGITAVGFWTLYIIILCAALVQYAVQIFKTKETGCRYDVYTLQCGKKAIPINFTYRDSFTGLNMPTVWVVATWVWLLFAGIMHHSKLGDSGCGANDEHESWIFGVHTAGVACVLIIFPLLSPNGEVAQDTEEQNDSEALVLADRKAEASAAVLRPTNRFTTRAQVAVDVNTPLNFA